MRCGDITKDAGGTRFEQNTYVHLHCFSSRLHKAFPWDMVFGAQFGSWDTIAVLELTTLIVFINKCILSPHAYEARP